MGEELLEPGIPNLLRILPIEKVTARGRFRDKDGFADLAGKVQCGLPVALSAPPGVTDPIIVLRTRIVLLELLGRGSAGGSVDGGEVGQVRVLKGITIR